MKKTAMMVLAVWAAVWGASAAEPKLTGIEVKDGGGKVSVKGSGNAGEHYDLLWTGALGAALPWETVGSGTAAGDGSFGIADGALRGAGFYCVQESAGALYLVVDMGGGPEAASWPVEELDWVPEGGWTDVHKTTKLVMRRIPAGTFTMGSPSDEPGRNSGETQHEVTISKPFYMGVFEVTQKQWELATGSNPANCKGDARPVECVSYEKIRGDNGGAEWPLGGLHSVDSGSFLNALRMKTMKAGLAFDLPTEAQWEYACRAGTATSLNSGKYVTGPKCGNMAEVGRFLYDRDDGKGGYSQHTKAGSYLPNAWGLYDMHGNVWEWCLDWSGDYGEGGATDPAGAAAGTKRVLRGGGWGSIAQACRSASRSDAVPSAAYADMGFRLAAPVP